MSGPSADKGKRVIPSVEVWELLYMKKYVDDVYEYRNIACPKHLGKKLKKLGLLSEEEWIKMGIQQTSGWENYMTHNPEPHILMFRRKLKATDENK